MCIIIYGIYNYLLCGVMGAVPEQRVRNWGLHALHYLLLVNGAGIEAWMSHRGLGLDPMQMLL